MYIIDSEMKVNLKHVEKIETNNRDNSILLEMVSGKTVVKKFATPELAAAELIAISTAIDGV